MFVKDRRIDTTYKNIAKEREVIIPLTINNFKKTNNSKIETKTMFLHNIFAPIR